MQRGYTLLELLIVITVIAVVTGIAMLSFSGFQADPLKKELDQLRYGVELAVNEAIVRSQVLGIRFTADGYDFAWLDDDGRWKALEGDRLLKVHAFAAPVRGTCQVLQDERIAMAMQPDAPEVSILPTGEVTPFACELTTVGGGQEVAQFDALGRLVRPEPAQGGNE